MYIIVVSCISKLFTKIAKNRLVKWTDENENLFDFRQDLEREKVPLIIFALQCLVDMYLSKKKGRFHSVFADFSKALTLQHIDIYFAVY